MEPVKIMSPNSFQVLSFAAVVLVVYLMSSVRKGFGTFFTLIGRELAMAGANFLEFCHDAVKAFSEAFLWLYGLITIITRYIGKKVSMPTLYFPRKGRPATCRYQIGDSVLFMDGKRKRRGSVTTLRPLGKQDCIEVLTKQNKSFVVEFINVIDEDKE